MPESRPAALGHSLRILVLMGVSGAGKTTVGQRLAERLDCPFLDGDALHSETAIAKMAAGIALTDADRHPWLMRVHGRIKAWQDDDQSGVITCSALKRAYRQVIFQGCPAARLVYLRGPEALIGARLKARQSHFMPGALLASQFADLQEPDASEDAIIAPVNGAPGALVDVIVRALNESLQQPIKEVVLHNQGEPR